MNAIRKIGRVVLYAFVAVQITAAIGFVAITAIRGGGPVENPAAERAHQHPSFI